MIQALTPKSGDVRDFKFAKQYSPEIYASS
jgi:hypothetical protein